MGLVSKLSGDFLTASFYTYTRPFVNGELGDKTWNLSGTALVKFYVGSAADSVVQERFRVELEGVILADPEDIIFDVPEGSKVIVDGVEYAVITAEDVAKQGQVFQIPVKRFK